MKGVVMSLKDLLQKWFPKLFSPPIKPPPIKPPPDPLSNEALLNAVNTYRQRQNRDAFINHAGLKSEAEKYCVWMSKNRVWHDQDGMMIRLRAAGFFSGVENIAGFQANVVEVVEQTWHNSDPHRINMLSYFRYGGAAFYVAPNGETFSCLLVAG